MRDKRIENNSCCISIIASDGYTLFQIVGNQVIDHFNTSRGVRVCIRSFFSTDFDAAAASGYDVTVNCDVLSSVGIYSIACNTIICDAVSNIVAVSKAMSAESHIGGITIVVVVAGKIDSDISGIDYFVTYNIGIFGIFIHGYSFRPSGFAIMNIIVEKQNIIGRTLFC